MRLLEEDPKQRYTAVQALSHPFINGKSIRNIYFNGNTLFQIFETKRELRRAFLLVSFMACVIAVNTVPKKRMSILSKGRRNSSRRGSILMEQKIQNSKFLNQHLPGSKTGQGSQLEIQRLLLKIGRYNWMNGFNSEDAQPKPGFKSYMAKTNNSVRNSNRDKYVPNMKLPK
jgi:serine/threonine protein kinase